MNVKDTEISILYYWAVSFHHRRRKIHCLPKANIKNGLNVSPIAREKLPGRFVEKNPKQTEKKTQNKQLPKWIISLLDFSTE